MLSLAPSSISNVGLLELKMDGIGSVNPSGLIDFNSYVGWYFFLPAVKKNASGLLNGFI